MVPVFNWSYESSSAKHQQCVIIICVYTSTGSSEQLHCLRHTEAEVTALCFTMTSEDFHLLYTEKMLAYVGQVLKSIMFQFFQVFCRKDFAPPAFNMLVMSFFHHDKTTINECVNFWQNLVF